MLHSGKKGMVKKIAALSLSVCLFMGTAAANGRFISYGDDLNRGDAVTVDMDRILKTLEDTGGEGKKCDLSGLPEEMRPELEDAVIVQKGAVNGLKYYMTAEYMGDADTENYAEGLQGISVFFVNQSRKRTLEMPAVIMEENDACVLSMSDEPEQVWEQLEEDTEEEVSGSQSGLAGTGDLTGKALDEDLTERETKEALPPEEKEREPESALPPEEKEREPESALPPEEKEREPESTLPPEEKEREPESTLTQEKKPQEPEDTTGDGKMSSSSPVRQTEGAVPETVRPEESQDTSDSVDDTSVSEDIPSETEYPTIPRATASDALETATPSEAVPGNAEDAGVWEVNPLSAKRLFIQVQFRAAAEECTFLTDVEVTTADGGSVSDTPIDIGKMVLIKWEYTIPDASVGTVTAGTNYTFEVPQVFSFNNLSFPIKNDGVEIGNVTLDGYEGTLVFNDTAASLGLLEPGMKGVFAAKGGINKDKIGNGGLIPVTFSPGQIINIYFPLVPISADVELEKSAELDSANNKVRWTIRVTPQMYPVQKEEDRKLYSLKIRDTLSEQDGFLMAGSDAMGTGFKVLDSEGNEPPSGTLTVNTDRKGFIYEFPANSPAKEYTVSYDTVFGMNSWNNTAADTLTLKNTVNRDFSYYDYIIDSGSKKAVISTEATEVLGTSQSEAKAVQRIEGGFISKSGKKTEDGQKIEWELTINKNQYSMGNIRVTDTITAESEETALPADVISITDIKVSSNGGTTYTDAPSASIQTGLYQSSFTLDINSVNDIVKIKYTTGIDNNFRLSNETTSFNNKVTLTIKPDSGSPIGIEGKGNTISTGYSLLEKSGRYDPATHSILWTIHVNKGKLPLENAYVKDAIPDGLTLAGGKDGVQLSDSSIGTVEYSEERKEIIVSYGADYEGTDTVTFSTTVDNPDLWAVNTAGTKFSNTAYIHADSGMAQSSYGKTADCIVTSSVFNKSGIGYDPVSKQVKWKLSVNENRMPMNGAVITDNIPDGQAFVDGGTVETSFTGGDGVIERYDYDREKNRLTVYLSSPLNDYKEIQYSTVLTDLSILQNNDKTAVENSAQLHCGEMTGTVTSSGSTASQAVSKSIVTKKGVPNGSKGTITWTVNLNQNRVPVENPVLTDQLNENLSLVTDSVKLIRINANGSEVREDIDASNLSYSDNKLVFSFNKTIYDEYRLEFNTYFKIDGGYTNSIDLTGNNGALSLSGGSDRVDAQYMAGGGETRPINKGQVRVIKTDEGTGEPIQGVTFSLSKGTVSQTAVTDENGIAEFTELWAGTYILKETDAPDGYYFSPDDQNVITLVNGDETWKEYNITNKRKCGIVVVVKDSENGALLPGAQVRLENKADPSEFYIKETGANGEVFFGELKEGGYIISEIKAPLGYNIAPGTKEANVSSSQDMIQVILENTAMKGSLRVIKVSEGTDTPLAGARIALYGQDGARLDSKVTGEDGLAEFGPIRYGDYLLAEEEAPEGYVLDTSRHPAAFHITSDGQLVEQKFENQKTPADSGHAGGGGGSTAKPGSAAGQDAAAQANGPGVEKEALAEGKLEPPSGGKMAQLQKRLPNGTYTIYRLDDRGTILEEQDFEILDSMVPLASVTGHGLPKVGDRRWSAQALAILAGLAFSVILWLQRRRDAED